MGKRLDLHNILLTFTPNVYFQPPESVRMNYPCIVYSRDSGDTQFADDSPYIYKTRYQVMVIDPNPDSEIPEKVAKLPMCIFDRFYTADNLNHDVYKLYY